MDHGRETLRGEDARYPAGLVGTGPGRHRRNVCHDVCLHQTSPFIPADGREIRLHFREWLRTP